MTRIQQKGCIWCTSGAVCLETFPFTVTHWWPTSDCECENHQTCEHKLVFNELLYKILVKPNLMIYVTCSWNYLW